MTAVTETPAAPPAEAAPAAPDQTMDAAKQWAQDYMAKLTEATNKRLAEIASSSNGSNGGIAPRIGEPTVGQYVAFDVAATSPIQPIALPPYQPSKVIAAGDSQAGVLAIGWAYLPPRAWRDTTTRWNPEARSSRRWC